ncbi:hypothetical protein FACS1894156_6380 [Bacteroidia bacterium]|nr:hypothetical protein FACS1894156_6380 [Bacteroidia bacterium]
MLVLTVNPIYRLPTDSTNTTICAGDTVYLWGKIFTQSGTYYDTLHTVHGCDSIRTLALTVYPEIEFTVADVVFVCADDEFIPIEHTVYNTYPSTYSIRFEDTQNYFTNIYNAPYMAGNAAPIRMGTPNGLVPGTYNASLQLSTPICNSRQAPFSITVHYPASFIVQKWNDVLAVLKTSNRFKAYQWLKNGEELYGATRSFLYETPTLDFTAMYSMRFTREDNAVLFTCPLNPQARDEDPAAYPTIVNAAAAMTITAAHAGEAVIRNTQGTVMSRQMFGSGVSNITVPTTTGLYFVELQTNEEAPRIIKIVVR